MKAAVTTNIQLGALNKALTEYAKFSRLTAGEILAKKGGQLAREFKFGLRLLRKPKGAIREEVLARLRAGKMIKVRESAKEWARMKDASSYSFDIYKRKRARNSRAGKKLNVSQLWVKREINIRESGRGILSVSSRYPASINRDTSAKNKASLTLSRSNVKIGDTRSHVAIDWEGMNQLAESVMKGIEKPLAQRALANAAQVVTEDMQVYIEKKQAQLAEKTMRTMIPK